MVLRCLGLYKAEILSILGFWVNFPVLGVGF